MHVNCDAKHCIVFLSISFHYPYMLFFSTLIFRIYCLQFIILIFVISRNAITGLQLCRKRAD